MRNLVLMLSGNNKKALTGIPVRAFYCRIMTSYFLWHLPHAAASFTEKALVPLWQPPQALPASMSFMVALVSPFFILKRPD